MPQYVIEREIPGAGRMGDEEIRAVSLKSLESLHAIGPQIQWLHSYVTEDKITASTSRRRSNGPGACAPHRHSGQSRVGRAADARSGQREVSA